MRGVSGRGFVLRDGREMLNRLHSLILLALLAASGTPGVALQSAPSASPQPTPEAPAPSSVVPPPPSPGDRTTICFPNTINPARLMSGLTEGNSTALHWFLEGLPCQKARPVPEQTRTLTELFQPIC